MNRFDKLEQTFQAVQSSVLDKVESINKQVLKPDGRISCLEKVVPSLKDEDVALHLRSAYLNGKKGAG